jgi:Ca2+-binding RTX toxin-like protein
VSDLVTPDDFDGLNAQDDAVAPWRANRTNTERALSEDITGSDFIDYIAGGAGDDVIDAKTSAVPLGFSSEGLVDTIAGGTGSDHLIGGDGDHLIFGGNGGSPHTTFGGVGSVGVNADGEFFYARAGEGPDDGDYIEGGAGNDRLIAGAGDDVVFGDGFAHWSSSFLYMSKDANQRKHIPPSSPEGALTFDKNKRSALCHIPVAKRLKSTSCCLNPLFVSTLGLMKGKQAA